MVGITVFINLKYFNPKYIGAFSEREYLEPENLLMDVSAVSDEYLPPGIVVPDNFKSIYKAPTQTADYSFTKVQDRTTFKEIEIEVKNPEIFNTGIAFFPGWNANLDGREIELREKNGFIHLDLPKGQHNLKLYYHDTAVIKASNAISFFSFILLLYLTFNKTRKIRKIFRKSN